MAGDQNEKWWLDPAFFETTAGINSFAGRHPVLAPLATIRPPLEGSRKRSPCWPIDRPGNIRQPKAQIPLGRNRNERFRLPKTITETMTYDEVTKQLLAQWANKNFLTMVGLNGGMQNLPAPNPYYSARAGECGLTD